ncbi:MAG: UMP kinase [bacterium]|nr:UMP kinase [bacterium]
MNDASRGSIQRGERVVVSVGGSLIVPDQIDTDFIKQFRQLIFDKLDEGFTFAITPGGGKTCRRYQAVAREVTDVSKLDLDWIGINTNCMHAEFLRILFGDVAAPAIVKDFSQPIPTDFQVILVGADAPGHSSDFDTVLMARLTGAKRLVNLSNIDYAYTADPKMDPDAEKIEKISWADFRKLIPEEWDPGLSAPFDPIAAREAEHLGLEVAIMNGAHLDRFAAYLEGKPFVGTVVS